MRVVVLFLILLNVGFYAWAHYMQPVETATDARPMKRQIEPERLRVVSPAPRVPPAAQPAPAPSPTASPSPLASAAPGVGEPQPPASRPKPIACLEWGSFTVADAPAAAKVVGSLGLGGQMQERRTEETASWWVFIPPQSDGRAGALRKTRELRVLGVEDYFIVQEEGPHRWAVSLGVFRTEAAANARLAALQAKKVRSAEVGPRETRVPKVWLQMRDVDPALKQQLETVVSRIPGTELRVCQSGG
jgi:SPOR domain